MANNTSPHVLNTSANLLGFCLFVITSLHISNRIENHMIDGFTSAIAVLLTCSCIFSFIAIKTKSSDREKQFESIADYFFISGLVGILVIILLIAMNFIK